MNIFALRRRDTALAELKVVDDAFVRVDSDAGFEADDDPQQVTAVSPANELATSVVELDIAEAVRNETLPPSETNEIPAPLSQRHLETIDRMVAHLKADERRLEQQITDARRQLADTQLARHGYERNGAELRRGIAALIERTNPRPAAPRKPRRTKAAAPAETPPEPAADRGDVDVITVVRPRPERRMH